MDYSQYMVTLGVATAYGAEDENFAALIPATIDYAEGRIYHDPDFAFLCLQGSGPATCGLLSRNITKPPNVVIVEGINIITPVGAVVDGANASRNPCKRVSLAYMDMVWGAGPSVSGATGIPQDYAAFDDTNWRLGPIPDATYVAEFVGTVTPTPLSATNKTTYLTVNMPELFVAASMIFLQGALLKNFGAQMDNPQSSVSWEAQFQTLKTGPAVVEARKKAESAGWTAKAPTKVANPPRN